MRRAAVLLLVLAVCGSAGAFDFGGSLDNTTGIARPPAEGFRLLVQTTTLAVWAQTRLGAWTLDGQGSYRLTVNPAPADQPLSITHVFDLDRLALSSVVPAAEAGIATFGTTLGRTRFADATGFVMRHTLDGLLLDLGLARGNVRLSAATTALLLKPSSAIVLGTLDALHLADPERYFAPARLLVGAEYRAVGLLAGQDVTVAALAQEDLRPAAELTPVGTEVSDPAAGGHVDTQYVALVLSGAVAPGLYHRTYYTLNSGRRLTFVEDQGSTTGNSYQYQGILAHLAGTELVYFRPELLNLRFALFGQFSTDGFVPLAPPPISDTFSLQPGNSAHGGLSLGVQPLAALGAGILQTELKGVSYFRTAGTGPVSASAVVPESDGAYVGTDLNLSLVAQPFSDLRLALTGGVFLANPDVMAPDAEAVDYRVAFRAALRF